MQPPAPIRAHEDQVIAAWIDRNGHLNLAYYLVIFDRATDAVFDLLGIGAAYTEASGHSLFVVETHTLYERELAQGARVRVESRILGADAKRLHLAHAMRRAEDDARAALLEAVVLHVDLATRRAVPFPLAQAATLAEMAQAHAVLPPWPGIGRAIAMTGGTMTKR